MTSSEGTALLGPLLFLILWLGMWNLIVLVLDALSGRPALLKRHPPRPEDRVNWIRFASGKLGWARFNNALTVGVGDAGLHVAPMLLLRSPVWRGIPCIPWGEVVRLPAPKGFWARMAAGWGRSLRLGVPALDLEITLLGRAAAAVEAKLSLLQGAGGSGPEAPPALSPR